MSLKIRTINTFAALSRMQHEWNSVAAETPFSTWEWMFSWAESYLEESQLFVLAIETEQDGMVGLLPLYRTESRLEGRTLRAFGDGEACTDYFNLFTQSREEDEVIEVVAEWLIANSVDRELGWNLYRQPQVPHSNKRLQRFSDQLIEYGAGVSEQDGQNCWRIELPESWDDYLASLSKSHRKQVRRVVRNSLESGLANLETLTDESSVESALESFIAIHQKRRKSLGEPGCFASSQFDTFIRRATPRLLEADLLRLHFVRVEGNVIAAEYQLELANQVYCYQAGIDPDQMDFEPGRLIMAATLQNAISSGCTGFDFLRGDEPYKAHFRAEKIPTVEGLFNSPTTTGKLLQTVQGVSRSTKDILKRIRGEVAAH